MKNHIYILNTEILNNKELFEFQYAQMPIKRREKIDLFRFQKDKKLSLGAGILLREGLLREGIIDIVLKYNKNGKPVLADRDDVYFNLSHSGELVVCAVSDRPVGVDIELVQHFDNDFVHSIYLENEFEFIYENATNIDYAFTELWTIKESLMKYLGVGVNLEPHKISVDMRRPIKTLCNGYSLDNIFFTQYDISGYALTICSGYEKFSSELEWILP